MYNTCCVDCGKQRCKSCAVGDEPEAGQHYGSANTKEFRTVVPTVTRNYFTRPKHRNRQKSVARSKCPPSNSSAISAYPSAPLPRSRERGRASKNPVPNHSSGLSTPSSGAPVTSIKRESNSPLESLPLSHEDSLDAKADRGTDRIKQYGEQPDENQLALGPSLGLPSSLPVMVSRWLDSLQDDPNYTTVAQACEDFLENQPTDGSETSQVSSAPPNFIPNSQSNGARKKRKFSGIDDGDDDDSIPVSLVTEAPSTEAQGKPKFACHFYKMNQYRYESCGNNGYGKISPLAEHLRKEHSLKDYSCRSCWVLFDNAEALAAHNGDTGVIACRATGGTPICKLRIRKTRIGDYGRWFWIWEKLFPRFQKPESPYWEPLRSVEQYYADLRHSLPIQLAQSLPQHVVEEVMVRLSRHYENWVVNPPEPRHSIQLPTPAASHNINTSDERSGPCTPYRLEDGESSYT